VENGEMVFELFCARTMGNQDEAVRMDMAARVVGNRAGGRRIWSRTIGGMHYCTTIAQRFIADEGWRNWSKQTGLERGLTQNMKKQYRRRQMRDPAEPGDGDNTN
jgi:hypothetical protein